MAPSSQSNTGASTSPTNQTTPTEPTDLTDLRSRVIVLKSAEGRILFESPVIGAVACGFHRLIGESLRHGHIHRAYHDTPEDLRWTARMARVTKELQTTWDNQHPNSQGLDEAYTWGREALQKERGLSIERGTPQSYWAASSTCSVERAERSKDQFLSALLELPGLRGSGSSETDVAATTSLEKAFLDAILKWEAEESRNAP